jgi:hypothetical protein
MRDSERMNYIWPERRLCISTGFCFVGHKETFLEAVTLQVWRLLLSWNELAEVHTWRLIFLKWNPGNSSFLSFPSTLVRIT